MASEQTASPQRWWILLGVSLGVLMGTLDSSIVNIALRTLVVDLDTTFAKVEWVVLSYLLVVTALILGVARLGDMFGKKQLYTGGLVLFTIGSVLCGLAPNIDWLIGFRAVQGLGAVMVTALGAALVTEVFPAHERGRAIGIIGSAVSVGIALGPSLGGLLLGWAGWRSIFLVNLPIGIVAVVIVAMFMPASATSTEPQRFDFAGAILLSATLACYALGMTIGQSIGFGNPWIIGLLVAAAAGIVVFLMIEARIRQPMLDLSMFRNGGFSMNLLLGLLVFVALSSNALVMPFFLEQAQGYSISQTGLMLGVIPIFIGVIAPLSGYLSDRFGTRVIVIIGLSLIALGYFLGATLTAETSVIGYLLRMTPIGIGFGVFQSPNNSAVMGSVPRNRLGVASGLLALSRTLGQTTGLPLMGALFASTVIGLGGLEPDAASPEAIVAGVHASMILAGSLTLVALALAVFTMLRSRRADAPAATIGEPIVAVD